MADMPPERSLVPKRPRSAETGDSSNKGVWATKHTKVGRGDEATISSPVRPLQLEPSAPKELASWCEENSNDEASSVKLESRFPVSDVVVDEPPGEFEKAVAPVMSAMPVGFQNLLQSMSRLTTLVPQDYLVELVSQEDIKLLGICMNNVAKAFVGLSELFPYVEATYKDRFNRGKELKRTKAELGTAKRHLSKKKKAARDLRLQIEELKERRAIELQNREIGAVEAFKESAEYTKILEDTHQQGIEECRRHIKQRRPHWDLSFLDIP